MLNIRQLLPRIANFLTVIYPLLLLAGTGASNTGLTVIAVLFLAHSWMTRDWNWCKEPWVKCLLALWVYIIVRAVFADFPNEALGRALPFGRYFIFAAALGDWTLRDETTPARFFKCLTLVLLFCAADGLLQWRTGFDLFHHPIPYDTLSDIRLTGPFTKPCLGIMLAWLSPPISFMLLLTEGGALRPPKQLAAGIAFALLMLAVIALSGERMALLLTLAGWALALFLLPLPRRFRLLVPVAGIALVTALALLSPELFHRQILVTINTFAHWQKSPYGALLASDLRMASIDPVFGVGTMHFRYACRDAYTMTPTLIATNCNTHPHNIYMEWLIENGVIGLALFVAAVVFILLKCRKTWTHNPLFIGLFIALVLRVWPLESSTGLFSAWGAPPLWLITGALLAYCARPRPSAPSDARQ